MTETIPRPASPRPASSSGPGVSVRSADILLNLVVIFLAPIFLSAANGDIALARLAATETVNSYRANSHADLLEVAQIVAFGFATLGSLCLSMADDISLTMVLRLRGNANALSRSAEAHRRRLGHPADISQPHPAHPPAQADEPPADAPAQPPVATPVVPQPQAQPAVEAAAPAPVPLPSAPTNEEQAQWAAAVTEAAEQLTAELPYLSPAERRMAAIQIAALSDCVSNPLPEASVTPSTPSSGST